MGVVVFWRWRLRLREVDQRRERAPGSAETGLGQFLMGGFRVKFGLGFVFDRCIGRRILARLSTGCVLVGARMVGPRAGSAIDFRRRRVVGHLRLRLLAGSCEDPVLL